MDEPLRAPDRAMLQKLSDEGPLVLPERMALRLWLRDLIDRHGPNRFRISGKGRAALAVRSPVGEEG